MAGKKQDIAPQKWEDVPEIPKEEQPYPLPERWKWVKLLNIAKWGSGGTPSRKHPEYYIGEIAWLKTGELEDNEIYLTEEHITQDAINNSSAKIFPINTVVMAMYGATIGKLGILKIEAATNQACACASCFNFIFYKYLFFYLLSQRDEFINLGKGGAQPNISQEVIKNYPLPLPPIETQHRIVNHIESLFSKLDEAAEKVQLVIDSHEARKQAILHKAFSGELTRDIEIKEDASWKDIPEVHKDEQPYPLPEGWKWIRLNNVITLSNETIEEFTGKEIYVGLENLEKGGGLNSYGDSQKIASMKNVFHKDAILYGKLRPYLNKHYVSEIEGICSTDISVFYAKANCLNKFVNYYFNTLFFIEYTVKNSKGINLPRVSPQVILKAPFPYPSLKIQQSVIHYIESLFFKLDEGVEKARELNKLYKIIKKDILFKAFNGMLE